MAESGAGEATRIGPTAPAAAGSFVDLYRAEYRSLVRLATLLVDDRATAEEVVQDAFVTVHGRLSRVAPDKATAYLRSAVLNGARSQLRRRRVRRRHDPGEAPPMASAESVGLGNAERRRVLEALRQLPRRQREVVTLRYYLDLSERETAESLGISVGSVKTHAHRGLAALAPMLGGPDDEGVRP